MFKLKNTDYAFGLIAILFHWIMAILIIALLILGLYMTTLPIGLLKLKLYGWHKEWGVLALMLVGARILWRMINTTPALAIPRWEVIAARATHFSFYFLMIALPLTGWMLSSAAGLPVSFFGLFILPDLVSADETLRITLQFAHLWLAYIMIAFICLHTGAALKHHFINKDDILRRMFP